MRQSVLHFMQKNSFWLSLLLHLLLLLSFMLMVSRPVDDERRPEMYIPSYIASPEAIPTPVPSPPMPKPEQSMPQAMPQKKNPASKNGIEKPAQAAPRPAPSAAPQYQSMSPSLEKQGIHLIGDEKIDKSLRTILGKAIAEHLYYPRSAWEYGVKGTVLVGFTLHPDGQVTDIQLVKSSNAGILNSAAMAAINEISPVDGVWDYVKEPRFLVVGIIFD